MKQPPASHNESGGAGAATVDVELEELPRIAAGLSEIGGECGSHSAPLTGTAAEILMYLGLSGAGRLASTRTGGVAISTAQNAVDYTLLSNKIATVHSSYLAADEIAKKWLSVETSAGFKVQAAFNEINAFSLGAQRFYAGLSSSAFKILFGYSAYMDYKSNPEMAKRRMLEYLIKAGIPILEVDKIYASFNNGYNRKSGFAVWDTTQTVKDPDKRPPRTGREYAQRLYEVTEADNRAEADRQKDHKGHGYSTLATDVYIDPKTGKKRVYLYLPGTDFDSYGVGEDGEIYNAASALATAGTSPDTPIDKSTLGMQMVEKTLREKNITKDDEVIMVGHSQGAEIAYNTAINKEFSSQYNVTALVSFGGPIPNANARSADQKFTVTQFQDVNDPIPNTFTGQKWEQRPGDKVIKTDRAALGGANAPGNSNLVHGMQYYRESLEMSPKGDYTPESTNTEGYEHLGYNEFTASSLPEDTSPQEATAFKAGEFTHAAIDIYGSGHAVDPASVGEFAVRGIKDATDPYIQPVAAKIQPVVAFGKEVVASTPKGALWPAVESSTPHNSRVVPAPQSSSNTPSIVDQLHDVASHVQGLVTPDDMHKKWDKGLLPDRVDPNVSPADRGHEPPKPYRVPDRDPFGFQNRKFFEESLLNHQGSAAPTHGQEAPVTYTAPQVTEAVTAAP